MRRIAPHLRLIRRRSWGSITLPFAGLIPSPGDDARFRDRRARVSFDQPLPAPTVFVGRPVHPACIVRASAGFAESRMWLLATSGLDLPSKIRSIRFLEIDRSCLGLCPLAGLRTRQGLLRGHHVNKILARNIRGLVTAGDSSVPGPLVTGPSAPGFAAPFLRGCESESHPAAFTCTEPFQLGSGVAGPSAFCEADASPIQQV